MATKKVKESGKSQAGKVQTPANDAAPQTKYDAVPYESFPYANTNPERLYTIGKLFGMKPVDFKNCSVLELGCASGGNLIPFASIFPNSTFVGVDLSDVQVQQGQQNVEELGLKNITLKTMSITDITEKFGKFDYIIAHGVLSWVPHDVQDKIFEVCSKNLNKNGIAYVSYNTLPGWNAVKSVREMMMYHVKNFKTAAEKVAQARLLLKFIKEANANNKNAYTQLIDQEIEELNQCSDAHLFHDHLEENNEPFYFHQVAERAAQNGLQYLGDTAIATMFPGNLPPSAAKTLQAVAGDAVKTEQYMDFIRNRRFRTTLLCHKDVVLNKNLSAAVLEDFYLVSQVSTSADLNKIDLTSRNEVVINFNNNISFRTANPAVLVALKILLQQNNKPIATKELLNKVYDALGASANKDAVRKVILDQFMRLVLADAVGISSYPGNFTTEISTKPKASELARYQAKRHPWITNQKAEKANIDVFNRMLIQHLDGSNDFDAILDKMVNHVESDELSMQINGKKLSDKKEIREALRSVTKRNIENLAPKAVLVA